jgi:hypothetical protein
MLIQVSLQESAWSSVWYSLSLFARLFVLLLGLIAVRTVYFALVVLVRLRSLRTVENENSLRKSLALLIHRSANLRQTILAMFYLFGLTFFLQIQNAFWTPDNNRPVGLMVLENFRVDFRFAAGIFFAFLVLHSFQWFVSARIRTAALRQDLKTIR